MSTASILKATHVGELKIGGAIIPCAVLEDGSRVLTQEGFLTAIGRAGKAKGGEGASVDGLPAFLRAKNLEPFISDRLRESTTPVIFKPIKGGKAFGYHATLLPDVCNVFLAARDKPGALHPSQQEIAKKCEILIRGLATIGITALVDEATGYQEVRDKLALQAILDKYLTDEWSRWTKRFPEEFYKQLFRLRGIPYPPTTKNKPGYIGHWTNDIVYNRLTPGLLKKLRELNPRTEMGHRARKHHQYFTEDYGVPELKEHIASVIFLMKSCVSWDDFKRRLERSAPKQGDQIRLPLEDIE